MRASRIAPSSPPRPEGHLWPKGGGEERALGARRRFPTRPGGSRMLAPWRRAHFCGVAYVVVIDVALFPGDVGLLPLAPSAGHAVRMEWCLRWMASLRHLRQARRGLVFGRCSFTSCLLWLDRNRSWLHTVSIAGRTRVSLITKTPGPIARIRHKPTSGDVVPNLLHLGTGVDRSKSFGLLVVRLPRKENVRVKRNRLIGGIVLLVSGALGFLALDTSSSVPVAIALAVVGIALVASSRRRSQ